MKSRIGIGLAVAIAMIGANVAQAVTISAVNATAGVWNDYSDNSRAAPINTITATEFDHGNTKYPVGPVSGFNNVVDNNSIRTEVTTTLTAAEIISSGLNTAITASSMASSEDNIAGKYNVQLGMWRSNDVGLGNRLWIAWDLGSQQSITAFDLWNAGDDRRVTAATMFTSTVLPGNLSAVDYGTMTAIWSSAAVASGGTRTDLNSGWMQPASFTYSATTRSNANDDPVLGDADGRPRSRKPSSSRHPRNSLRNWR